MPRLTQASNLQIATLWADALQAEQEARARELLHHLQHVPQHRWMCQCGELVEGGFEQCWSCTAWMPR